MGTTPRGTKSSPSTSTRSLLRPYALLYPAETSSSTTYSPRQPSLHRLHHDSPFSPFLATLTRFGGGGTAKPAPRQIYAATTSMRTDMPR